MHNIERIWALVAISIVEITDSHVLLSIHEVKEGLG